MGLKKPAAGSQRDSGLSWSGVSKLAELYPALCEWMTSCVWPEDGSRRVLPVITLWLEETSWKACLKCKATSRICFVTGASPETLLAAVEAGLAEDRLDWRRDKFGSRK